MSTRVRMVRGVSVQADAVFTLLQRSDGERPLSGLARCPAVNVAPVAAAELEALGLTEPVGADGIVRLTPAAAGVVLVSRPG